MIIPRGRNEVDGQDVVWIPGSRDLPSDDAGEAWTYRVGTGSASGASAARIALERYGIHVRPVAHRAYARFVASERFLDRAFWQAAWPAGTPWPFGEREEPPLPRTWRSDPQCPLARSNHPVLGITWYEALVYARFVGGRLPSAGEWEVAAAYHFDDPPRRHRYPWGDGEGGRTFEELFGVQGDRGSWDREALVEGTRNPTTHCEMMVGFHWEWTSDPYDDGRARPAGRDLVPSRVLVKGGSPRGYAGEVDCASRFAFPPDLALDCLTFRCVFEARGERE